MSAWSGRCAPRIGASGKGDGLLIYLDNAATSDPKPAEVIAAMSACLGESNANPGRGAHRRAVAAARIVYEARVRLADLLGVDDPARLVFTAGCTDALHLALHGLLGNEPGRVTCSSFEHNAVWRPLRDWARRTGGLVLAVPPGPDGTPLDMRAFAAAARQARLCVLTHASNVSGAILPVQEAAEICRRCGIPLIVDAAQTAGHLPEAWGTLGAAVVTCSGHKGLLGPQGTGLLYVAPGIDLAPVRLGGTGGNSEEDVPPPDMPERFEAGTLNTPGIAGLGAAAGVLGHVGLAARRSAETEILGALLSGLESIPGLRVVGPQSAAACTGCVSVTVDGWDPARLAEVLDGRFGIATRAGLHCAPLAHRTLGTFQSGTLRLSPGWKTTETEIEGSLRALDWLARRREAEVCAST